MPAPYPGGCLCGAIRYRVNAEPLTLYACHCTDCQRRTGSAFALSMIVRRNALELLSGNPVPYAAQLADGRSKHGVMCAACGTRLWGEPAKSPTLAVVQPGNLDDTSWLRPVAHQWVSEAQPWVVFPPGAKLYDKQPTDPMELGVLWRNRAEPR